MTTEPRLAKVGRLDVKNRNLSVVVRGSFLPICSANDYVFRHSLSKIIRIAYAVIFNQFKPN